MILPLMDCLVYNLIDQATPRTFQEIWTREFLKQQMKDLIELIKILRSTSINVVLTPKRHRDLSCTK